MRWTADISPARRWNRDRYGKTAASADRGAAGVLAGAAAVTAYARSHTEAAIIPVDAWAGGLAAAIVIGALAGLLPAIRAARLSPTQALWSV